MYPFSTILLPVADDRYYLGGNLNLPSFVHYCTGNSRKSLERGRPLTHRSGTIVILHDIDMKLIILVCCLLGLSLANEEGDDLQVASTEVCIIYALNLASNQW